MRKLKCHCCEGVFPETDFSLAKNKKRGRQTWCKKCFREDRKIKAAQNKKEVVEKRCACCKRIKPARAFNVAKVNPDGLFNWCKSCKSEYFKDYDIRGLSPEEVEERVKQKIKEREEKKERAKIKSRIRREEKRQELLKTKIKKCSSCKKVKDKSAFAKKKSSLDGLQPVCNDCLHKYRTSDKARKRNNEYQKQYRKKQKQKRDAAA